MLLALWTAYGDLAEWEGLMSPSGDFMWLRRRRR